VISKQKTKQQGNSTIAGGRASSHAQIETRRYTVEQQISARGYERLPPGTTGTFYWPGRKPTPVMFEGMDGVEVLIEGEGVRPRWHQGLHAGQLQGSFSWNIITEEQYKYLYCFNCHIGQLHERIEGKWQCLNCGIRREDEPESSPYNDDDPGDIPSEFDILSETQRRLSRIERAAATMHGMLDCGIGWITLDACLDLIDHIDAAGEKSRERWDDDPGEHKNNDPEDKMLTYPCSHCGEIVSLDQVDWIDSGTTLFCPVCDGPTIVELQQGTRRTTTASDGVTGGLVPIEDDDPSEHEDNDPKEGGNT